MCLFYSKSNQIALRIDIIWNHAYHIIIFFGLKIKKKNKKKKKKMNKKR